MKWLLFLALASTASPASAGEWKCLSGNNGAIRVLAFEGGIERGEFDRFRAAFAGCFPDSYAGQRTVDLDSGGGSVTDALRIARALARESAGARPVATQVSPDGVCISACTYLFISGRLRNVRTGGSFEPHGFSAYKGPRIDQAISRSKAEDGTYRAERLALQVPRLLALGALTPLLSRGDDRFGFAAELMAEFSDPERLERRALPRLAQRFLEMPGPRQAFILTLDSIVATAIPELERVAALKGFESVLAASGATPAPLDERRYFQWVVREVELAANGYLRSINDARPAKLGDDFLRAVLTLQRERVESVVKTVREELGPFLESRSDQVDVAGLVKLMFSVSILYTRPLTREELCDLNIVNRDCGN